MAEKIEQPAVKQGATDNNGARRIGDLTVDEFTAVMVNAVRLALYEIDQENDPDQGLSLNPEVKERLQTYLRERPQGRPAEEVYRQLGIDV